MKDEDAEWLRDIARLTEAASSSEWRTNDAARLRSIGDRLEQHGRLQRVSARQDKLLKQLRAWDMFTGLNAVGDAGYWCGLINELVDEYARCKPKPTEQQQ